MQQINEIILPIFISIFLSHIAYIIGFFVIKKIKIQQQLNFGLKVGLSIIIGYGLLGCLSLILSFFGPLNKIIIYILLFTALIIGFQYFLLLFKHIKSGIKSFFLWQKIDKLLFIGILFCFLFYLSSALVPPYRTDALAYHLPNAIDISNDGMYFPSEGEQFFKILPALMEVLYAMAYSISGFILINLTHYTITLSGLFVIYNFIKKWFNRRKGLIVIIAIFSLYELFVNATNSYVDAVMAIFEICGFLLLLLWIVEKDKKILLLSGACYGFALSIKYNALYGLLIAGFLLLFNLLKNKIKFKEMFKMVLYFSIPVLIISGFWYIKNLILLGNPIYPFYFGHKGYTDATYSDLMNTIKLFKADRTLLNFILLPFYFFLKSYYIVVFASFIAWPIIFFTKKTKADKKIFYYISSYIIIYTFIWFFIATHQYKFFFVPMVLLLIIFGIQIDLFFKKIWGTINHKIILFVVVAIVFAAGYKITTAKNNYFIKVKKADIYYNLGIDDESDFYAKKNLGSIYKISDYINKTYKDTTFLNVWGATNFFLKNNNKFAGFNKLPYDNINIDNNAIIAYLKTNNINYAIIDNYEKKNSFSEPVRVNNPVNHPLRKANMLIDGIIKKIGVKIYEEDGIELYNFSF